MTKPSGYVGTPTYFSPDAKMTKVIACWMYLSGAREEEQRADQHRGHAADDDRRGHAELHVPERQRAEGPQPR